MIDFIYRVITFVERVDGSEGGFSRIIIGGGVLGGGGRSEKKNKDEYQSKDK
jgi:hypothetical protein